MITALLIRREISRGRSNDEEHKGLQDHPGTHTTTKPPTGAQAKAKFHFTCYKAISASFLTVMTMLSAIIL